MKYLLGTAFVIKTARQMSALNNKSFILEKNSGVLRYFSFIS
jgi:hypothetical protein